MNISDLNKNGINEEDLRWLARVIESNETQFFHEFKPTTRLCVIMFRRLRSSKNPDRELALIALKWNTLCKMFKKAAKSSKPHKIARFIHKIIDGIISEEGYEEDSRISCKKGCSNCCSIRVDVTKDEAYLLSRRLQDLNIDCSKLEEQRRLDSEIDYIKADKSLSDCVFLDEQGLCKVYEDRPISCRTYHVATDPKLCNSKKYSNGFIGAIVDIELELAMSAAFSMSGGGNLSTLPQELYYLINK